MAPAFEAQTGRDFSWDTGGKETALPGNARNIFFVTFGKAGILVVALHPHENPVTGMNL